MLAFICCTLFAAGAIGILWMGWRATPVPENFWEQTWGEVGYFFAAIALIIGVIATFALGITMLMTWTPLAIAVFVIAMVLLR
jgi:hypothetical protein